MTCFKILPCSLTFFFFLSRFCFRSHHQHFRLRCPCGRACMPHRLPMRLLLVLVVVLLVRVVLLVLLLVVVVLLLVSFHPSYAAAAAAALAARPKASSASIAPPESASVQRPTNTTASCAPPKKRKREPAAAAGSKPRLPKQPELIWVTTAQVTQAIADTSLTTLSLAKPRSSRGRWRSRPRMNASPRLGFGGAFVRRSRDLDLRRAHRPRIGRSRRL